MIYSSSKKYISLKKGKIKNLKFKAKTLKFGTVGLKVLQSGILKIQQIDSIVQIIQKKLQSKVKIWRIKLNSFLITKKPIGIRMGKGIGKITTPVFKVKGGDIILEFSSINNNILADIVNFYKFKLPIKSIIIFN